MSVSRAPGVQTGNVSAKAQVHPLPVNSASYERWDLQHEVQKRVAGGIYYPRDVVQEALVPKDGRRPTILDAGTGSGIWAVDMANEFPQCDVIGIDLIPPPSVHNRPPNLRFEVADVTLPLPIDTASIDFAHARMMERPLLDHPKWLAEISRILSPGGVYMVISADLKLIQEDGTELPTVSIGEEGYTGLQNIFSAIRTLDLAARNGVFPRDLWTSSMAENGNFDKIGTNEDIIEPVGPWKPDMDENARIASELMRQGMLNVVVAFKHVLLQGGHDETIVDRWIEDAIIELNELRVHVSTVWASAWCRRSGEEWKSMQSRL